MNKKNKNTFKIGIVLVSLFIIGLAIGLISQSVFTSYSGTYPAYAIVKGTSDLTCNTASAYDKQFLPYRSRINLQIANNANDLMTFEDNDAFNFYIFDSNGKSPRGLTSIQEIYQIGSPIPANILCDGTKDCNFGFTTLSFVLEGDFCVLPPELTTYYRYSNNMCSQVRISSADKTINDYETLSECESKIIIDDDDDDDDIIDDGLSGFRLWLKLIIDWIKQLFGII